MEKKMKNEKYVKALWDCYQKGIGEELEKKELFLCLIDDAINQVIEKCRVESSQDEVIKLIEDYRDSGKITGTISIMILTRVIKMIKNKFDNDNNQIKSNLPETFVSCKMIVEEYLKKNNFDGLYCDDCGCTLKDLMPCGGEYAMNCIAGYKIETEDKCELFVGARD